jgi:hypothetical protein
MNTQENLSLAIGRPYHSLRPPSTKKLIDWLNLTIYNILYVTYNIYYFSQLIFKDAEIAAAAEAAAAKDSEIALAAEAAVAKDAEIAAAVEAAAAKDAELAAIAVSLEEIKATLAAKSAELDELVEAKSAESENVESASTGINNFCNFMKYLCQI